MKQSKVTCEEKAVEHNKTPSQRAQSFETLPPRTLHFPAQKEFFLFVFSDTNIPRCAATCTLSHGKSEDVEVYRIGQKGKLVKVRGAKAHPGPMVVPQ